MRLVVVYILLATTTLFFLKFSSTSQKPHHHRHRHLGPRQGNGHAAFDPLAGQFKGILTQGKSYSQIDDEQFNSFPDALDDPKEYFSEEGLLNITGRLQVLFPLLDRSPEDGVLSFKELEAWNARQAINRLIFWTNKTLKEHDKDGDEAISFSEYLNHVSEETTETDESMDRPDEWLKERFLIADVDGNRHLNLTEFNDLLHPEESDNRNIQLWLIKEKIREMDDDKDGKLNFNEFRNKAYTTYEKYFEFASGNNDIPDTEEKFAELDLNKDRLLTADELRAFFRRFHSGELSYAKRYTRHLITEVDQDRDGKLTLDEMLARPHVFYSTVLTGGEFQNDDDNFHDEL